MPILDTVETVQQKTLLSYSDILSGWWYTYPSEKYESHLEWLFPTEWRVIKFHGSSQHQPDSVQYVWQSQAQKQ